MRTAVCIRFCVAAKEEGAGVVRGTGERGAGRDGREEEKEQGGAERAAGGNEASASCPEAGREREQAGVWEKEARSRGARNGQGMGGGGK